MRFISLFIFLFTILLFATNRIILSPKEGEKSVMEKYFEQAVMCVKDSVLPVQRRLYESCGGDLDRVYGDSMNNASYFGKVLEPGRVYELGYHKCTCQMVLSGSVRDPAHCECTRQSILYILKELNPNCLFEVEILETVLLGSQHCRFRITRVD